MTWRTQLPSPWSMPPPTINNPKMSVNPSIRQVTLDDLNALAQLFDAYRVWYGKDSDLAGANKFLKARMEHRESVVFVADASTETQRSLAGFTQLYPIFSSTRMQRMWLLNDLFVDPDHRGQGWSTALIDAAKELAQETNAAGLLLETEPDNQIANRLYQRTGFQRESNNFYFWSA